MIQFNREIPTLPVSFGQPYYLYDAPNFSTYINAYASLPEVQAALVERLVGDAPLSHGIWTPDFAKSIWKLRIAMHPCLLLIHYLW
ncbi:glycoside hydrolase [Novosphingobium sp. Rr 2-17]|uniref:hypothetical protein n=1 Tax=Novosphingobium sp. Rr 2-17 TaxID=555793 RepID=UPI00026981E3|nr:hypothetical protein [Novosphingobium sp. Rr 2-17]EIZ79453.1 glycoside hydrolase [Novosphingobium sp. Rr 2-17]